jgi:hypothetical protein
LTFTPAIGEHLVALALDSEAHPYRLFRLGRFADADRTLRR